MGPSDVIVTMCTYDFIGTLNGETQVYGARRAHPVDRCRFIARAWKKLTRGEPYVCLNGEGGGLDESSSKPCDLAYWREEYPEEKAKPPKSSP